MKYAITIIQGAIMGAAEIIPGVSGSTLALAMGIYEKFIDMLHQISDIAKEIIKLLIGKSDFNTVKSSIKDLPWSFMLPLLFGMLAAIGLLANVISQLLDQYPAQVSGFFFGLIVASTLIPWSKIEKKDIQTIAIGVVICVLTFVFLGLTPAHIDHPGLLLLFFGGMVGISGMVLPGVSGSFILLMIGIYEYVVGLVKQFTRLNVIGQDVVNLVVFLLGLGIGFLVFVRILKWLLNNYKDKVLAGLIGLMFGSLRVLWPFGVVSEQEAQPLVLIFLILLGVAVVMLVRYLGNEEN